jgi:hypothetical protein
MLSCILPKKQRTYVPGRIGDANQPSKEMRPVRKPEQLKDQGGLLSLVLELLGAVAIRLVQRYFKSWRSTLMVKLHNPPEPRLSSTGLPKKAVPKGGKSLPDHRSEISSEKAESEMGQHKGSCDKTQEAFGPGRPIHPTSLTSPIGVALDFDSTGISG